MKSLGRRGSRPYHFLFTRDYTISSVAPRGEFEPFKTSSLFDGTAENPDWLGEVPERLQKLKETTGQAH
jgi:hypothetical protein